MRGMFIVLEGADRIGKTTQCAMLADHFARSGVVASSYTIPAYRTPTGEVISQYLRNLLSLSERRFQSIGGGRFGVVVKERPAAVPAVEVASVKSPHEALVFQCVQTADKYAVASQILDDLRSGRTVVCCRWWQSAYVYGLDDGLDEEWLVRVHELLPRADVNILLHAGPESLQGREVVDRVDGDVSKQSRLRSLYLDLWSRHGVSDNGRPVFEKCSWWQVVRSEGPIGEVHERVMAAVEEASKYVGGDRG